MSFLFELNPVLAFFDVGGVRPLTGRAVEASAEKRSSIIYYSADIQAACKTMREAGDLRAGSQLSPKCPTNE